MAGSLYLGSQKVCPAVLVGETGPKTIANIKIEDGVITRTETGNLNQFDFNQITEIGDWGLTGMFGYYKMYADGNTSNNYYITHVYNNYYGAQVEGDIDFSNLTKVGKYGLALSFNLCRDITGTLDLSSLETVDAGGLYFAFSGCRNITGTLDLSSLTTIGADGLMYAFYDLENITGDLNLSSLTTLGGSGLEAAFAQCFSITNADLSSLSSIPYRGLYSTFSFCTGMKSIDLSSVTSITGESALEKAFARCDSLESVDLSSLTTITVGRSFCFDSAFEGCGLTRIDFPSLNSVPTGGCFGNAFLGSYIKDVYFNALTTSSFGGRFSNQFATMFDSATTTNIGGVTVHFPSNLESTIQGLTGYPLFGGASGYVTLAFDLPATS